MVDYQSMSDRSLEQLAIENRISGIPLLRDDMTFSPADRQKLISKLQAAGAEPVSNSMYAINQQIQEYEELFPEDTAERDLYLARVPPQQGVRGPTGQDFKFTLGTSPGRAGPGSIGEDTSWYSVYTTPGGVAFLEERGYEVRPVDEIQEDTGVVIAMPRHRARPEQTVGVEAPYGQHHTADIVNLPPR